MAPSRSTISVDYLMKLVKSFVEILILASGCCSSGLVASWDAENVGKAVRWGIFFEQVFKYLNQSDDYIDIIKELDASLLELTSSSCFPQGLRDLSSESLSTARSLVLKFFSQSLSLGDKHLHAILTTSIEMDQEDFSTESIHPFVKKSAFSNVLGSSTEFVFHELVERHASMSRLSICEASLDTLLELVLRTNFDEFNLDHLSKQSLDPISLVDGERLARFRLWNCWRRKNLSYLLSKRTVKLLSGCGLIFSAPKAQWVRIFDSLTNSNKAHDASLLDIVELSLMGFISSRWMQLIDHFMAFSCDVLPVREQYFRVLDLLQEGPLAEKMISEREKEILEFCTSLLAKQPNKLWELPPILVAAALPSWSTLFRSHVGDIGRELKGEMLSPRCSCREGTHGQYRDCSCQLAERIWCFYVFHVQSSSN